MSAPAAAPFPLAGAVYLVRPTGRRAQDLGGLEALIADATPDVLFHHTQMPRLRDRGDEEAPPDDFSQWIRGVLKNPELAERMAFAVQGAPLEAEALRRALLEILRGAAAADGGPAGSAFVSITCDPVLLPIGTPATPAALWEALAAATSDVWFHHLVEAGWNPALPALGAWLRAHGAHRIADRCDEEAVSGRAIGVSRRRLLAHWRRTQIARRLEEAQAAVPSTRRALERDAVAGLVRRMRRPPEA